MPSFVGGAQAKDVSSLHLPSSSSCRPLTLKVRMFQGELEILFDVWISFL